MTDTITKLAKEFTKVKEKFKTNAQVAMKKAFKEFFAENPSVMSIYWTQYTPHFNDGDECNFGVHEMYYSTALIERDGEYIEDREGVHSSYGDAPPGGGKTQKNFKAFTKALNQLPDEIFQDTFGDHCEIIASREGFDVEEYSHD
jgi:hypothetical protein